VEYVAAQYFYEQISAPKTATATTSPSLDQRTWHRSNTHYRNSFQIQKALNCDDAKVNGIATGTRVFQSAVELERARVAIAEVRGMARFLRNHQDEFAQELLRLFEAVEPLVRSSQSE
jgi:hypothetical protein